jgi:uncharacterized membrane protein YhhN
VNGPAWILLVVAFAFAALDWVAVIRQSKPLEYVCKPATAVAFLATASVLNPADETARSWLVIALVFCVFGDVFLMLPRDAFIPGLASFAMAQILFAVSFALQSPTSLRLVIALVVVVPGALILARRFLGALSRRGDTSMAPAILVYVVVISTMIISGISGGTAIGIAGAVLFLTSDSLIAEQRFVSARRWQPLTIIVSYHLALAGLVLGLI